MFVVHYITRAFYKLILVLHKDSLFHSVTSVNVVKYINIKLYKIGSSGLYSKGFTIVIYNRNNSKLMTVASIINYDSS
jgi:hypothetical protein